MTLHPSLSLPSSSSADLPNEFDDLDLAPPPVSPDEQAAADELVQMGFRRGHVANALVYVSHARRSLPSDPLSRSLATLPLRTALLSHLHLHVPEEDLPPSLRSSRPADATVRNATSMGVEALGRLWKAEKLAREVGVPVGVVESLLAEDGVDAEEGRAVELLVRKLVGWTDGEGEEVEQSLSAERLVEGWVAQGELSAEDRKELEERREDELVGLEGMLGDRFRRVEGGLEILASTLTPNRRGKGQDASPPEQVILRVLHHSSSRYPTPSDDPETTSPTLPTFYVYSSTLPPYLRLHLTSLLARQFLSEAHGEDWRDLAHAGYGGVVGEMASFLQENWKEAIENPPDSRAVLANLLGSRIVQHAPSAATTKQVSQTRKMGPNTSKIRATPAMQEQLKAYWEGTKQRQGYQKMLETRSRLPAWKMQREIVELIRSNRVVIVSGETGSGKTTQGGLPSFVSSRRASLTLSLLDSASLRPRGRHPPRRRSLPQPHHHSTPPSQCHRSRLARRSRDDGGHQRRLVAPSRRIRHSGRT